MQTEQGQSCCERLLEKEKLGSGELKKIIKHFCITFKNCTTFANQ
jgi:hypothetical protein